MQALFRVLMLVVLITGLALSAASVRAQQFSPPLPPDITPQWTPIPGAPGVQHAPNANADLFRYGQRYYYQHDGKWYQGRNIAGPWQRVQDVPRSFRQIQANYFRQPPEWAAPRPPFPPTSRRNGPRSREPQECITPPMPTPTCSAMGRGITTSMMASGIRAGTSRVRGKGSRTSPGVFARSRPLILSSPQDGPRGRKRAGARPPCPRAR